MYPTNFNFLVLCFLFLLVSILVNSNTALHLLLTAELLWITIFSLVLVLGIVSNNLNLLALTFFFLVFSAVEFGLGLVLILLQNTLTRSINLIENDFNKTKAVNRFSASIFLNRLRWKF